MVWVNPAFLATSVNLENGLGAAGGCAGGAGAWDWPENTRESSTEANSAGAVRSRSRRVQWEVTKGFFIAWISSFCHRQGNRSNVLNPRVQPASGSRMRGLSRRIASQLFAQLFGLSVGWVESEGFRHRLSRFSEVSAHG